MNMKSSRCHHGFLKVTVADTCHVPCVDLPSIQTTFLFFIEWWRKSSFKHDSPGHETNVCIHMDTPASHLYIFSDILYTREVGRAGRWITDVKAALNKGSPELLTHLDKVLMYLWLEKVGQFCSYQTCTMQNILITQQFNGSEYGK